MSSVLARTASSVARRASVFARSFSAPSRRLITKGVVSPMNTYPKGMMVPDYVITGEEKPMVGKITVVNDYEIQAIRDAGRIAKKVCEFAGSLVKPGVTLDYIDKTAHEYAMSLGYYPSCLGFCGFPKSMSISVNEVVCHSIPDSTVLEDGDIVKIDLVMYVRGWHGDTCRTFLCGNVDEKGRKLVESTKRVMDDAIAICKPGVNYSDIGNLIESEAREDGFNVVADYAGHGIGRDMHTLPYILHFANQYGGKMVRNQVFTIEPMLVEGSPEVFTWKDGWTVATKDNGRCAQFEHTILIHDDGAEVLTWCVCYKEERSGGDDDDGDGAFSSAPPFLCSLPFLRAPYLRAHLMSSSQWLGRAAYCSCPHSVRRSPPYHSSWRISAPSPLSNTPFHPCTCR